MAPPVTQTFDMTIGEYGQDYAVPVGTPIYSPVAGIFGTEDLGKSAWGKRAFVHAASGISFAVGHLSAFALQAGQVVHVGDLIGYSGGAITDPSSGVSTGPHVETQFTQFVKGQLQYIDPRIIFASFTTWEQSIFGGSAAGAPTLAGAAKDSSSTQNPFAIWDPRYYAWALNAGNPVNELAGAIVGTVAGPLTRAFWIIAGLSLFGLGLGLVFFNDIETVIEKGQDAADKAGKLAANVAAPEVAVPAEAAAAA